MELMLKELQDIIYQVTGKQGVTYDTDFVQDLELNSFDIMNIISAVEERYDMTIPTRDVRQLHQVRDAIEYMRSRRDGQS